MLLTIILAALAAVLGAAWAIFWAFVRDQGQPRFLTDEQKEALKAAGRYFKHWKKIGLGVFPLPIGLGAAWVASGDIWTVISWGFGVYAWTVVAWAQGHKKGLDLTTPLDWLAMAGTGAWVTAGLAADLAWHGHYVLAALVLLAGAFKAPAYWIGYRVRGRNPTPQPHATLIGALLAAVVAYSVSAAAMVLA